MTCTPIVYLVNDQPPTLVSGVAACYSEMATFGDLTSGEMTTVGKMTFREVLGNRRMIERSICYFKTRGERRTIDRLRVIREEDRVQRCECNERRAQS